MIALTPVRARIFVDLGIDPKDAEEYQLTQTKDQTQTQGASQRPIHYALPPTPSSTPLSTAHSSQMIPRERLAFNSVHVLPSMTRGRVVGVSKGVPHSDIKMFQSYRLGIADSLFKSSARDSISRFVGPSVDPSVRPSLIDRSTRLMAINLV